MTGYEAFVLTEDSRQHLKSIFPPKYPKWFGHHVTHRFPATKGEMTPYDDQTRGDFEVIGYAHDDGIEALVVRVPGHNRRPDGGVYHLTWSLDPAKGKKPVHSNAVIREKGWTGDYHIRFSAKFSFIQH